ncbi:MAG: tRNA-intron lyase [Candidatus Bathyarchaeota archaeon]|nr:tRNA-intron lyase [Candidatus Bathyarchaeota archaeon]
MSNDKENTSSPSEFKAQGLLTNKGVKVEERSSIDALSQRGYGAAEKTALTLAFYEALFLMDKQNLSVKDKKGSQVDFESLLHTYEAADENAWMHYIIYRDLRSRGYVVREGFGTAIDFRIYERGTYGKETATALIVSTQEGKPMPMEDLAKALSQTQSLKKELVLAVMNRRGEIVYYSVAPLTFK